MRQAPRIPPPDPGQSATTQRSTSSLSSISNDSQNAAQTAARRVGAPAHVMPPRPSTAAGHGASSTSVNQTSTNFSRLAPRAGSIEEMNKPQRSGAHIGHRPRQHSQGFFEPTLPTASASNKSTSTIAAAAAMNHLGPPGMTSHERKRSVPGLAPLNTAAPPTPRAPSPHGHSPQSAYGTARSYSIGVPEESRAAASAVFPKSPAFASATPLESGPSSMFPPQVPEKTKEKSKMKLFHKPKAIGIIKDKDLDKKLPSLPSPGKRNVMSAFPNASTVSLADSTMSSSTSMYSSTNASTSTLVPNSSTPISATEKDKEKHRPHFLSRQKKSDKPLPLSSASSNSQFVDPSAPQSLYSFAPQSPGVNSAFSKSVTGLDLRHGGKGLRDRRKEEKAAAASFNIASGGNATQDHRSDFLGPASYESSSFLGPLSATNANSAFSFDSLPSASAAAFNNVGNHMGLSGITPDDAWPLLKARLLQLFEGQPIRTPVEDFNLLVSVHIRRCVSKRAPVVLVEDLRELLDTGFASLAQTLRNLPDDRIVPNLAEMWQMIYCVVLPFIQAVFLPLDLEFRGHGMIMTAEQAGEFWGAMPDSFRPEERPTSSGASKQLPSLGEELDVRRMTLVSFRDQVILPRHETLLTVFSRLSLDSINAGPSETITSRSRGASNPVTLGAEQRPGTGGSLSPRLSSYSSQTSTLLDATNSSPSQNAFTTAQRSRATSSTSAGSFGTSLPHLPSPLHPPPANVQQQPGSGTSTPPQASSTASTSANTSSARGSGHSRSRSAISVPEPMTASLLTSTLNAQQQAHVAAGGIGGGPMATPTQVTETVARMLQCVSIIAGVQTGDDGQARIERLTGVLKHNWLGRGRTGRQRKGFIGMRIGTRDAGVGGLVTAAS